MAQLPPPEPSSAPAPTELPPAEPPASGSPPALPTAGDLELLNPEPPLLSVPTSPAEVTIDVTQPLTLQQVIELVRRNNLDLQIAELQLRQSRAALRQARAAQFPTVSLLANVARVNDGAPSQINPPQIQPQQIVQQQLQSQLQQRFQQQRSQAQQQLLQDLQQLQTQLQQGQDQLDQLEVQQQVQTLQQRTNTTAVLPQPPQVPILSPLDQLAGQGGGVGEGTTNFFNSTLSLNYNIYTSGRREASIRAAQEQVRLAELEVERQTLQLLLDTTNDYYSIQQADALVVITQGAIENAQLSLRDTEALERAGLGTRFDVLQAQVELARALQNQTQALNLQQTSRRLLAQRLNLAGNTSLVLADPVSIAGRWSLSLEESITEALANRAELAQLLVQRNIALQRRRIALAAIGPQLSAFANFNLLDQFDDGRLGTYGYALGVQFSMSLFDGGAARASARQQEDNVAIAETQFAATKNQIRFQVEQAYATLESSFANIQTAQAAVEQAEESLRLARLRFQAGVGTQLDVTSAEADLTQAAGNRLAAIIAYNRALASLQRAVSAYQPLTS